MTKKVYFPRAKDPILQSSLSHITAVHNAVKHARRFFSPSATNEIMEEFLTDVSPHSIQHTQNCLTYLTLFIPTSGLPPPKPDNVKGDTVPFHWIPTLFSIWSLSKSDFDKQIISVLGRLAKGQVAFPWNLSLDDDHVGRVFSAGLRCFGFPVGSGSSGSALSGRGGGRSLGGLDTVEKIAKLTIQYAYITFH